VQEQAAILNNVSAEPFRHQDRKLILAHTPEELDQSELRSDKGIVDGCVCPCRCWLVQACLLRGVGRRPPEAAQNRYCTSSFARSPRSVANTKIGQGLGVHAHSAAQPPIGDMLAAKTRHLPRARHALDRREKPQSQQDARIRRRMAGPPLEGFDWAEGARVKSLRAPDREDSHGARNFRCCHGRSPSSPTRS
jgi:hypothetical protein